VLPPLSNFPSGDDVVDATQINQSIEQQVRNAPEQYLWLHRHFKTRPPGEEGIYS
jgi:KDO2-lipid IV(A) lauroyltransferase